MTSIDVIKHYISEDKVVVEYGEDENKERGNWSGKFDFFLSCVGYAVGLGNVWRFPYLCYQNGGGAFLVPYFIMLTLVGIPTFFFELSLGQFSNLGPLRVWKFQPMFKGVGYAMIVMSSIVSIYYNIIIAWSIYYLFASMTSKLPWAECNNPWNDNRCVTNFTAIVDAPCNMTLKVNCTSYEVPAEQYWQRVVLGVQDYNGSMIEMKPYLGNVQWHLCLCLLLAWIICVAALIKGVKSSGKVVYFTAVFPYFVIIIMVINGATLKGSLEGIKFYIIPEWSRLLDHKVWTAAASQIFYSLGVGFGGLLTMASYNRFHNNCHRDAVLVSCINCFTSFLAGFAIFSVLGFIANQTGREVKDTATSGSGLAFVVYAQGLATMPAAPLWSILFFTMLLTLGIDSQFGGMEAIFSGIQDEYPILRTNVKMDVAFKIGIGTIMFFLGLPLVSQGGIYLFSIADSYSGTYSMIIICVCELIASQWLYGYKKFAQDIKMMLGKEPNIYFRICWMFLSPLIIIVILIATVVAFQPTYYNDYKLPTWADALGFLMALSSILAIPGYFIYYLIYQGFTLKEDEDWGPGVKKYWKDDARYAIKMPNETNNNKAPN